jgi:uncharacterized protein
MQRIAKTSILTLIVLLSLAAAPPGAVAHEHEDKRTISLAATGTVKSPPDKVDISTGVTSDAKTASAALAKNTQAMTKIVAALKEDGIEPKDIQTVNFSVMPLYEQVPPEGRTNPEVIGYRVTNQVRISVHNTKKLGALLDKVVTLGANQIDSIEFGMSDPDKLKDEARKQAVQNAIANAKLYAEAAGVELGPIQSISEEEYNVMPRYASAAPAMEMSKDVPIEGGTTAVEVRVRVTWEIK